MIKDSKIGDVGSSNQKNAWNTPTLIRIDAGEAEVSTRSGGDGVFTFS